MLRTTSHCSAYQGGRHEWLALEQLVNGQLRVVEGQDRFAFHLMDCLYHLHYFEQEGYVGALHCF
jgi:hypothetical protein